MTSSLIWERLARSMVAVETGFSVGLDDLEDGKISVAHARAHYPHVDLPGANSTGRRHDGGQP